MPDSKASPESNHVEREHVTLEPTRVRHLILGLTIAAYAITYMDRVVISTAVPSIEKEFGFSIVTMGWILSSFQWAYALFQIPGGWLGDRLGPRRALTLIVTWWSLFTSATIFSWNALSMAVFRFLFGMGEAGAFPTATRSLSRWILPVERGFAQGATHAGSRLGGAVTPAIAGLIIFRYGWRAAFVSFGSLGLIWAAVWFWYYRDTPAEHKSVNAAERALIQSSVARDRQEERHNAPWRQILASRQLWILCAMYFCYAYNLGVYLVWFPKYLNEHLGYSLRLMGLYASLPLMAGTIGDVLGGWTSDLYAKRTGNLKAARRVVGSGGFAFSAVAIVLACTAPSPAASVLYSCLATFALELTVGVSWAIPLDIGGDYAGSVSAVMNTFGNLGGATAAAISAYLVMMYGWNGPFVVMTMLSVLAAVLYWQINAGRAIFTPR
jgi:sugar phosphate permease